MKKIKNGALILLVILAFDYMSYILFSFPSLFHYATLHPVFEKWYALCCGISAMLSLFCLKE